MPKSFISRLVCYTVLSLAGQASAVAAGTPVGKWLSIDDDGKSKRAEVEVTQSNGVLTGRIIRVLKPGVSPEAICSKCTDDRKNAPVKGLEIIRHVKQSGAGDVWNQGEILDPTTGKTYHVEMTLSEDGKVMHVRGYIGISLFGRTQVWRRME